MDEAKFNRLPKWAQQEINRLDANCEYWKGRFNAGPEESDTFLYGGGFGGKDDKPLGKGVHVFFRYGERWAQEFDVSLRNESELWVSGGSGLLVAPYSANVVRLRIERG